MMDDADPVVIVGGGLAGLVCGRELHRAGQSFVLIEASDDVGGRVRTDIVDGFRLDRGFQVLLTAYPAAQKQFDYASLRLKPYTNGSLIRLGGRFHRLADPWRQPLDGLRSVFSGVGSLMDKLRIAKLRARSRRGTITELFNQPETTTAAALRHLAHLSQKRQPSVMVSANSTSTRWVRSQCSRHHSDVRRHHASDVQNRERCSGTPVTKS